MGGLPELGEISLCGVRAELLRLDLVLADLCRELSAGVVLAVVQKNEGITRVKGAGFERVCLETPRVILS